MFNTRLPSSLRVPCTAMFNTRLPSSLRESHDYTHVQPCSIPDYPPPFVNHMTIPMYIVQPCENIPHEWNHISLQSCDYIPNIPPNSLIIGHSMNYTYTPLLNAGLYKTDAVATFQPIPDFIMHMYQYFPCIQYCDCILGNSPLLTSTEWMWRQR